jgi:predicted transposase YbfD/YdcC
MELPNLKDSFFEAFSLIEDPRSANSAHSIETVLFCLLIGVICGADGFVRAEQIADLKKDFIRRYVPLGKKVPTHDTMARLLARIDPDQFVASFARFMRRLTGYSERDILNFDGQTLRGVTGTAAQHRSRSKAAKDQEHIVTAFSTMRCIVLAQIKTLAGVNEVSAAQELLTILDVKGAIITADAMHACAKTFEMIKERGADYVVTLKQNTPLLCDAAELAFRQNEPNRRDQSGKVTETRRYEIVPSGDLPALDTAPWGHERRTELHVRPARRVQRFVTRSRSEAEELRREANASLDAASLTTTSAGHLWAGSSEHNLHSDARGEEHCRRASRALMRP